MLGGGGWNLKAFSVGVVWFKESRYKCQMFFFLEDLGGEGAAAGGVIGGS